ncbi:39S ribosomal protein L10, mitochondrial [Sergentomyia squamirostris]
MTSMVNKIFLQTRCPLILAKRFRGKINIQRPRKPHYERALVEAVTTPVYQHPPLSVERCTAEAERKDEALPNPYLEIIAREIHNWFNHSQCTGIFHMNSMSAEDHFNARVVFHKQNMHLKSYPKKAIHLALSGSRYEEILPLFEARCAVVFSPDGQPSKLLKVTKKTPHLILIGAIAEERILNRNQFTAYAALPSLDIVRAQFANVLHSAAVDLVSKMETHQGNLVRMLEAHAKSLDPEK